MKPPWLIELLKPQIHKTHSPMHTMSRPVWGSNANEDKAERSKMKNTSKLKLKPNTQTPQTGRISFR